MGILSKLGLKKKQPAKPEAGKEARPEAEKQEGALGAQAKKIPQKSDTGQAYQILLRPILSEKGTSLASRGKYVFAVHQRANKSEIRKSIQKVYDVHVNSVKIINLPGKMRRYGRTRGRTANWKKTVVTLRAGEKIPGIIEAVG